MHTHKRVVNLGVHVSEKFKNEFIHYEEPSVKNEPKDIRDRIVQMGVDRDGVEVWENSIVIVDDERHLRLFPAGPPLDAGEFVAADNAVTNLFINAGFRDAFCLYIYLQQRGKTIYGFNGEIGTESLTHELIAEDFQRSTDWIAKRLNEIDQIVGLWRVQRYDYMSRKQTGWGYFVGGTRHKSGHTYSFVESNVAFSGLRDSKKSKNGTSNRTGIVGGIISSIDMTNSSLSSSYTSPNGHIGQAAKAKEILQGVVESTDTHPTKR